MTLSRLLTGAALALGLATTAVAQDKTKVGFIYVGPIGDGGWTYEHDKGRLALEEHFGDKVETVYQESVPEGADAERAITQIVQQAQARWKLLGVTVIHRVGKLYPTDQIVLVAIASQHRGDAFAACEFIMDFLKTKAPIWKKETTPEGALWVSARQSDDDALERWQSNP